MTTEEVAKLYKGPPTIDLSTLATPAFILGVALIAFIFWQGKR